MIDPLVLAEQQELAHALGHAHADDSLALSLLEVAYEPGIEPDVVFCINGIPVFTFRRDDFLDAIYVAGCDAIDKEARDMGPPLR
jgi:hypothetical protein